MKFRRFYKRTLRNMSPSIRREWIEIPNLCIYYSILVTSPSIRREWIEIYMIADVVSILVVSLHTEGVD